MVETPVLFITFVRPEYARKSWNAIKAAKPKTLYFYSNKGRVDKEGEVERNNEIRAYINEIDWDCDLHTFFRDECVDIYTSLWGAMDWLFDNEEQGIVLEEDCVASLDFFKYCDNMLRLYKDNKDVAIISGNNRTPQYNPKDVDCFLSKYVGIYGWATWSDRWHRLDKEMKYWPQTRSKMIKYFGLLPGCWYLFWWQRMFNKLKSFNPWDSIFAYNNVRFNSFALVPVCNLVEDIGRYGVHHEIIEENESKKMTTKIGIPGSIYENPTKHALSVYRKYERGHFHAIFGRDFSYIFKKVRSIIKKH